MERNRREEGRTTVGGSEGLVHCHGWLAKIPGDWNGSRGHQRDRNRLQTGFGLILSLSFLFLSFIVFQFSLSPPFLFSPILFSSHLYSPQFSLPFHFSTPLFSPLSTLVLPSFPWLFPLLFSSHLYTPQSSAPFHVSTPRFFPHSTYPSVLHFAALSSPLSFSTTFGLQVTAPFGHSQFDPPSLLTFLFLFNVLSSSLHIIFFPAAFCSNLSYFLFLHSIFFPLPSYHLYLSSSFFFPCFPRSFLTTGS